MNPSLPPILIQLPADPAADTVPVVVVYTAAVVVSAGERKNHHKALDVG